MLELYGAKSKKRLNSKKNLRNFPNNTNMFHLTKRIKLNITTFILLLIIIGLILAASYKDGNSNGTILFILFVSAAIVIFWKTSAITKLPKEEMYALGTTGTPSASLYLESVNNHRNKSPDTPARRPFVFAIGNKEQDKGNISPSLFNKGNGDGTLLMQNNDLVFTEEYLDSILENMNIGFVIHDADGRIQKVSSAAEHILGFTKQELCNKKIFEFLNTEESPADYSMLIELISGARKYCDFEKRLMNNKGQTVWARVIGHQIKNGQCKQPLLLMVIVDITEHKETEKIKDAFIDMVAHEIKNPLMAVISSLRLAKKDGQFPDVLHELIGIASDGAESLWSILENLLEVNRARAGRLQLAPVISSIPQLIEETITTVRPTLIHRLVVEVQDKLPRVTVDPARVHLILRNLIDNAIKYSPKGGDIHIFAECNADEIIIAVKDQGIGISKDKLHNLFQPFERLGATSTRGSGLGLAVCRMLVTYHKGRIWVESEQGKGSTFYFALPLNKQ